PSGCSRPCLHREHIDEVLGMAAIDEDDAILLLIPPGLLPDDDLAPAVRVNRYRRLLIDADGVVLIPIEPIGDLGATNARRASNGRIPRRVAGGLADGIFRDLTLGGIWPYFQRVV